MVKEKVIWHGSVNCDICNKKIEDFLYDSKTVFGPWAVMCKKCMSEYGTGIGKGRGQEYVKNEKGEFEKIFG